MKIWLVNPFDPLPGEHEQLGRYASIAKLLRDRGHDVTWWTSTFSHRFKRAVDRAAVDRAAKEWGISVEWLDAPPYAKNISFARLRNHRILGQAFAAAAPRTEKPDLILASSPPLELADIAASLGQSWKVPTLIDIQDQWPDNFTRAIPSVLRPLGKLLFARYYAIERRAYRATSGFIGVANGYVRHGVEVGGAKRLLAVCPLGVDLAELRTAMSAGAAQFAAKWPKPPGTNWLMYTGSLSHNYDFLTVVRAAAFVQREFGDTARFIITGTGELADQARQIVTEQQLTNVTLTGFVDFNEYAYLLSQADVGFNAAFPDALIYLPNKIFYYFAAGAAVLNTIPGECESIVAKNHCGLTYTAGDVDGCAAAISMLLRDPDSLLNMQANSRRLAETVYDRPILYAELVRFLESIRS